MSPLALSVRFLQTQPDRKLLELARAGHERAFEALVQRYRRPLLSYCRRLSHSEASAEDALQQALMQAWIALSAGEGEIGEVRAWLYRIVHNVAISNLRRPVHDQVHEDLGGDGNGADLEVERRLAIRSALAGLAALPELQRRVMLSTALEGRSHDEVATALGLSHGAVRGLIYRARATLRAAAAAVMPGPLISWAARQDVGAGGRPATIADAIAGGSAGVAGALLKGGAIVVTAGALAGAAGVALHPHSHRSHAPKPSAARLRLTGAVLAKGGALGHAPVNPATGASAVAVVLRGAGRSTSAHGAGAGPAPPTGARRPGGRSGGSPGSSSSGSGSKSKGGPSPRRPSDSSNGSGGSSGSLNTSGASGSGGTSGQDGSSDPTSGSDSGATSGTDGMLSGGGGGDAAAAATSSGSDGSSSGGGSSSTEILSSDGGSGSSSGGSSDPSSTSDGPSLSGSG